MIRIHENTDEPRWRDRLATWRKRIANSYAAEPVLWNGAVAVFCAAAAALWTWHYTDWTGILAAQATLTGIVTATFAIFYGGRAAFLERVLRSRRWLWLIPLLIVGYAISLLWGTLELRVASTLPTQRFEIAPKSDPGRFERDVLPKDGSKKVRVPLYGGGEYIVAMKPYGWADVALHPLAIRTILIPDDVTVLALRVTPTNAIALSARSGEHDWRLRITHNGKDIANIYPYRGAVVTCGSDAAGGCGAVRLKKEDTLEVMLEQKTPNGGWRKYTNASPYVMQPEPSIQEVTLDAPH